MKTKSDDVLLSSLNEQQSLPKASNTSLLTNLFVDKRLKNIAIIRYNFNYIIVKHKNNYQ